MLAHSAESAISVLTEINETHRISWGNNELGTLGNGKDSLRVVPTRVVGNLQFASIALGSSHACGLTTTGEAHCWGNNAYGQLGDGTTAAKRVPTKVSGTQTFRSISAGGFRTCAVTANGETHCWGQKFGSRIGEPAATGATLVPTRMGDVTFGTQTE